MFTNIWNWIKSIIGKGAKALEKPAKIAVEVVNAIKEWVYNPIVDVLTSLSKTDIDNKILETIKYYLPSTLRYLLEGEKIVAEIAKGDFTTVLEVFKKFVLSLTDGNRGKWWADLAASIMQLISGSHYKKNIDFDYAKEYTQEVYRKNYA